MTKAQPAVHGEIPTNNSVLFESPILGPGPHNLTIDVLETGDNRSYTLWSFFVKPVGESKSSMLDDNRGSNHHSHTNMSTGAIVGSIVGAFVLVLFITIGIVYFSRRRRRLITKKFEARHFGLRSELPQPANVGREY